MDSITMSLSLFFSYRVSVINILIDYSRYIALAWIRTNYRDKS
jgi:hypothetical protein